MVIWEFLRSRQFAPFTINQNHVYHPLVVAGTEPILLLVTQHLESGQMLEWVKPAFFPSAQLFGGITVLLKKPVCLTDNSTTGSFPQPSVSSVAQSCPTLCNPVDCSSPGSSVHGIFQARILVSQSVQLLSCVQLFVTPWTAACQAALSITNSRSLLQLMSIESVMPSNRLILCHPLLSDK